MPSSFAEHSMPNDSTPRSFAALIVMPPGSFAPTMASALFDADARIGRPADDLQRLALPRRDAAHLQLVGLRDASRRSRISATTTPEKAGAAGSTLRLQPGHGERVRQLARDGQGTLDQLAQPVRKFQ